MSITLAQAIKNSIIAEYAAVKFYLRLAERCRDDKGRAILTEIAAQERRHARALEESADRLVDGQLPERGDALVHLIESAPAGAGHQELQLIEALEIAVDAENSAILYYDALASTTSGEAATFFEHMRQEEEAHAAAVRALLEEMRDGQVR